jgi:deazaflavin-dependent oxidoreductase (nitroreductase family)
MDLPSRREEISGHQEIGRGPARAPAFMVPIFKSPVFLYRLGMGCLFGHRFMMLTHVGRRSRKVYHTILAILRFDERTREVMAISAWTGSDWYKNIQACPALLVETGFTRYVPEYRTLTSAEIAELFVQYRDKHPLFSRIVCRIPDWKWNSNYDEFLALARSLRGIAFRPRDQGIRQS